MFNDHYSHFTFSTAGLASPTVVVASYDLFLVCASVIIAIGSSYIAFVTAHRISHNEFKREITVWHLCASLILGIGIWAMHFVGMLAYRFGMPVSYNLPITLLSIVPAVFASYVVISSQQFKNVSFLLRTVLMGAGISSMHYVGMMAMQMNATMVYDPWLFALSIVIGILLSGVALKVDEQHKRQALSIHSVQTLIASIVMGIAISGTHYIGMYAMYIVNTGAPQAMEINAAPSNIAQIIIAVIVIASLLLIGLVEYRARVLAAARFTKILNAVQDGFINFAQDGHIIYCNPAAARLFEYTQEEIAQYCMSDLIDDEQGQHIAKSDLITRLLAARPAEQITERLIGKKRNGDRVPIAITMHSTNNSDKSFVCILRDLSDLSRQEVFTQRVFDNLPLAIIVKHAADLTIAHVNVAAQKILEKSKAELIGSNDFDIFSTEDAERITASDTSVLTTSLPEEIAEEAVTIAGESRYFTVRKTLIFNNEHSQSATFLLTVIEDITELRNTRKAVEQLNKRMAIAADAAKIGFWEWNAKTKELILDDWMHKIYALPKTRKPATFSTWAAAVHPDDYPSVVQQFEDALHHDTEFHMEFRVVTPENNVRYVAADGTSEDSKIFGVSTDITARVVAEKKAERLSLTDSLTGLANRNALSAYVDEELARNQRKSTMLYCSYIDLDNFKPINDTHGHKVGDEALIEIAKRLSNAIRQSDCAARIGGDEFVVILTEIHTDADATHLLSCLHDEITSPIRCSVGEITIDASMGVACFPAEGTTLDELLSAADGKMYQQKRSKYQ